MSDFDFKDLGLLLSRAGININAASKLFKVSRQTLYMWMSGEREPSQELIRANAVKLVKVIERAVDAGALPHPRAKVPELAKILRQFIQTA